MIGLARNGALAVATLARPPVNAINDEWLARFGTILDELAREATAVLWIRSAERVFCAGADLELMRAGFPTEQGRAGMLALAGRMQEVFARLERAATVSIAEVGGAALGGGFELALACDLRVVADTAEVGLPEVRLGLLPGGGGTQRLTRLCGAAIAKRLILGAETVRGAEAVALGLAHWAAPRDELQARTGAIAERIAALPAAALAACKRCIGAALEADVDGFSLETSETQKLYASAQTQELVTAFLETRRRAGRAPA